MEFLFLLYGDELAEQQAGSEERARIAAEHRQFAARMQECGALVSSVALAAAESGSVLHRSSGGVRMMAGPLVPGPGQLGAVYVLRCSDLEHAVRIAEQMPLSPGLTIEVRPTA